MHYVYNTSIMTEQCIQCESPFSMKVIAIQLFIKFIATTLKSKTAHLFYWGIPSHIYVLLKIVWKTWLPFPVITAKYPNAFIGNNRPSKIEVIYRNRHKHTPRNTTWAHRLHRCVWNLTLSCLMPLASAMSTLVKTKMVLCPTNTYIQLQFYSSVVCVLN